MQVIYRLTSPSGRVYIGQTKHLATRMSSYRTLQCQSQPLLCRSLQKHGFDQHVFHLVHRFPDAGVSQHVVDEFEKYTILMHRHMGLALLNLTPGGRGNGHRTHKNRVGQPKRERPDVQGEKHKEAKLTTKDVIEIRSVYEEGRRRRGCGIRQLARRYNVSPRAIYGVVHNKTWRHIGPVEHNELLALQFEAELKIATRERMVKLWGPKIERTQCTGMKSKEPGVRCAYLADVGRDTCVYHSPEFRESSQRRGVANIAHRERLPSGQFAPKNTKARA